MTGSADDQSSMEGFDSMLTDENEKEEGVQYVTPSYVETKLSKDKKMECRGIVRTINQFGISQRQKLFLIYLLALELENRESMLKISRAVADSKDTIEDAPMIDTGQPKHTLVLTVDNGQSTGAKIIT
jgi:hypothetical protein